MPPYRVIAIPTAVADSVRATLRSPRYGHPAHAEVATGHGPCRHCLRTFRVGHDRRLLFTWDAFFGAEAMPHPGPVFVHADACERYPEDGGFPAELRARTLSLEAYAHGRRLRTREEAAPGRLDEVLQGMLARDDVDYVHVFDAEAGCFDLRIARP